MKQNELTVKSFDEKPSENQLTDKKDSTNMYPYFQLYIQKTTARWYLIPYSVGPEPKLVKKCGRNVQMVSEDLMVKVSLS